ncbi:hypothetical protein SASPL_148892 [Salvia splendens]|uniref:RING-type E3 ubiquitin transferase n=1 Tax=Salvia splendens TaxID=180675 RepID=A0A8X8WBR0_SALSN|nr:E3 ubiquitin-protein ligase ATL31-like [Salvia splendens]KAG6391141.1 hypothetical protein SASPL_148892 [Salvia splendens]
MRIRCLDAAVIGAYLTFPYVEEEVEEHKIGKRVIKCAVCLNKFEDDETLRLIPKCNHIFRTLGDLTPGSSHTSPVIPASSFGRSPRPPPRPLPRASLRLPPCLRSAIDNQPGS